MSRRLRPNGQKKVENNNNNKKAINKKALKYNVFSQFCRTFCSTGNCPKGSNCKLKHDATKIAICQSFLYGQCDKRNCLLSHEKIPDKMPDCLFFSKNCCKADNCIFRHVKVNENASLCPMFLKGFCLKGTKCRLKHKFLCRTFKQTSKCPKGNNCKFAHEITCKLKSNKKRKTSVTMSKQKQPENNSNVDDNHCEEGIQRIRNGYKVLNELLAKRLMKTPTQPVSNNNNPDGKTSGLIKLNPNESYIKLSSLGDATESNFEDYSHQKSKSNIVSSSTSTSSSSSSSTTANNNNNSIKDTSNNTNSIRKDEEKEMKKYFIIDNDDEDKSNDSLLNFLRNNSNHNHVGTNNSNNNTTSSTTTNQPILSLLDQENECRPSLKIIPDFLLNVQL